MIVQIIRRWEKLGSRERRIESGEWTLDKPRYLFNVSSNLSEQIT